MSFDITHLLPICTALLETDTGTKTMAMQKTLVLWLGIECATWPTENKIKANIHLKKFVRMCVRTRIGCRDIFIILLDIFYIF